MEIKENYDLTGLNTFGVKACAKFFVVIKKESDIPILFSSREFKDSKKLFLGGGSNILFTSDFDGIVILNKLQGISILKEEGENVLLKVMGGESWHDTVLFAVNHNLWGIENLSLIPGTAGAAPIQNIGAYGVELKDTLLSIEAYDIEIGEKRTFNIKECNFGYRDSIFKNSLTGKYFISSIILKLSKIPKPNISYKILKEYMSTNSITEESLKNISDAVSAIRRSKLPDPKEIPNAGSFFKNIFIKKEKLEELLKKYPELPNYQEDNCIKIPSAWLIEQAGWKGYREKDVGVHHKQALVLVNHGKATGEEIKNLAEKIIASVEEKFGLKIVPEVNIV